MMFLLQPDYIVKEIWKRQWNQGLLTAGWTFAAPETGMNGAGRFAVRAVWWKKKEGADRMIRA